ncbi:MAG: hypothetical protein JJT95_18365 [Pararhodobacter sp.]|nr:hypothetical protein [Pararhodobacter sp.]
MTVERQPPVNRPHRPLWVVGPVLAAGMAMIALLIAFAAHFYAYEIIIYSLCIGISGGIFAALLTDRLGLSSNVAIAVAGAGFAMAIYCFYWFILYRITYWGAGELPLFFDHLRFVAENSALGRRGRNLFAIGPGIAFLVWAIEILVVIWSGGTVARKLHTTFATL